MSEPDGGSGSPSVDRATQAAINESEWRDPANWSWGIYRSPRDTRVWVPKPVRWQGATLNFAHKSAWLVAALLIGLPLLMTTSLVVAVAFIGAE